MTIIWHNLLIAARKKVCLEKEREFCFPWTKSTWLFNRVQIWLVERHQVGDVLTKERARNLFDLEVARNWTHEVETSRSCWVRVQQGGEQSNVISSRSDKFLQNFGFLALRFFNNSVRVGLCERLVIFGGQLGNCARMIRWSRTDPDPDCVRSIDVEKTSSTSQIISFAFDLNAVSFFGYFTANDVETRLLETDLRVSTSAAEMDDHATRPEVEEGRGLTTLNNSDLRTAFSIQLHGHQGWGTLFGDTRLAALPEKVGPPFTANGHMLGRTAFQISA